jgi:beta-glucosidase-like glycosyl hydrolase
LKPARLIFPALRWSETHGFNHEWEQIDRGLGLGVGGFLLFGGEARAVRDLTDEIRRRAGRHLLIASDLERGAGQQFSGATPLPPAAAIASLNQPEITRRAGEVTARDARAVGVDWVFAPVADVDLEPANPIVGVRAFGSDPASAALHVGEWVRGCRDGGALCCAKHFPGHGRTRGDSHVERPSVEGNRKLLEDDLLPFRAAIAAGVDSVMTAHVAYPGLDPSGAAATLSPRIIGGLLRRELGFTGIVVTDALVMKGLVQDAGEPAAARLAVAAGCDALLYPEDAAGVVSALGSALRSRTLDEDAVAGAVRRIERAAGNMVASPGSGRWGREEDRDWALDSAVRTLRVVRGEPRLGGGALRLVEVEDDLGGPHPPCSRETLPAALGAAGVELRQDGRTLVAVYADIRAWKGRPGLSAGALERVRLEIEAVPEATVILFSHPRRAAEIPFVRHLLAAWGGEAIMQQAVARWLTRPPPGTPRS